VIVSRCQLLDAGALRALGEPAPPAAALAVTIGSVPEGVRIQGEQVARGAAGAEIVEVPDAEAWWARVADLGSPEGLACDLGLRIGTRPGDVVKAIRAAEAVLPAGGRLAASVGVANGVVHLAIAGIAPGGIPALVGRLREGLAALGGTCVVEHAPAGAKRLLDVWGDVGPALPLMKRLKAELDPQGVLNPGRFVGGI
jgi:glycolate oxidase FAD binding subunit